MYSIIKTAALRGIRGIPVYVEADISRGMPVFEMVGFLASEVKEAKERVRIDLEDMEYRVIRRYPLLAVMPASHPLSHRASIQRSELKGYPLVDIKKSDNRYGENTTILNAFTSAGFLPNVQYVSDDIETSILAVAAGLGYALLPSYITDALTPREKVIAVPLEGEEKRMTVIAAWHRQNENPALEKFLSDCIFPAIDDA